MKNNLDKLKLVREWFTFAKENLLFARAGMKEDFAPFHTICFLCQGSAEKHLKGYLISKGWKLKKIHDLDELVEAATEFEPNFEKLFPFAEILNEYLTEGRYPADLAYEAIGHEQAKEAIAAAEKIAEFVISKIDLPDNRNILGY